MGTYITLVQWTEQGVRGFRDTTSRNDQTKGMVERFGGRVVSFFWTIGPYDGVAVTEFADDETAAAFGLALASEGDVRTTTLRAFDTVEMDRVVSMAQEMASGVDQLPPDEAIIGKA